MDKRKKLILAILYFSILIGGNMLIQYGESWFIILGYAINGGLMGHLFALSFN